ncbi:MAG: AlpA family transcriptional regulator [Pseudomonadales bacterium]|nr:AlpA family transcriptional regulator [Pseudomonadales bacterium]
MRIMRLKEVMETTGLGRSSIYKYAQEGAFPKPVSLGGRSSGWVSDEVEEWVVEQITLRDEKLKEEAKWAGR